MMENKAKKLEKYGGNIHNRLSGAAYHEYPKDDIRIFFKSLRKRTDHSAIESVFSKFGEIKTIHLPFNQTQKKNLGYGHITYRDPRITLDLISRVKRVKIEGKTIKLLQYDVSQQKKHKEVEEITKILSSYFESKYTPRPYQDPHRSEVEAKLEYLESCKQNQKKVSAYHTFANLHVIKPTHTFYYRVGRFLTGQQQKYVNYELRSVLLKD